MKKILVIAFALCICLCICACNESSQQNTTSPSEHLANDPNHTHNYGQWVISKAATCTEDGEEKRACECGSFETKAIAKGHTEVVDKAVAATCTKAGLTEGKHCSVCNTVIVKQETVNAKGHTIVTDKAVAATCTKAGLTEGKHCSVCYTVTVKQETINAKGHTTGWGRCSRCNNISTELADTAAAIEDKFNTAFDYMEKSLDYVGKALNSKYYSGTSSAVVNLGLASGSTLAAIELCGDIPEFAEIKQQLVAMREVLSNTFSGTVSVYGDYRDLQTLKAIVESLNATEDNVKKICQIIDIWHTYK